jgi:hypothetical protein
MLKVGRRGRVKEVKSATAPPGAPRRGLCILDIYDGWRGGVVVMALRVQYPKNEAIDGPSKKFSLFLSEESDNSCTRSTTFISISTSER